MGLGSRGARQCARAFRDIGEELSGLEGVCLLLQELIVECRQASLLRLLRLGASGHLSLGTLQGSALSASSEGTKGLRGTRSHAIDLIAQGSLLRRRSGTLAERLIAYAGKALCSTRLLTVDILAEASQRLTGAG